MKRLFSKNRRLYLITDTGISGLSHAEMAERAISAGIGIVQLREKGLPKNALFHEAMGIRILTRKRRVKFIVNDYVDIALAVDADGVHLGQGDLPISAARKVLGRDKIIGISTRTRRQAIDAESSGADYIGFGPVFSTATKKTVRPRGLTTLRGICELVDIPVVAIGGIRASDAAEVLGAGAGAMAVASGILRGDITMNVRRYSSISGPEQ